MNISFISSGERELLNTIEESNSSEVKLWKLPTFVIPVMTVVLSIICFMSFKQPHLEGWLFLTYVNLILNGSLPLIALNQVSSGIYLLKYDKSKEKELGITDTFYLRAKLFYLFIAIVSINILFYVYQVINTPFSETWPIVINLMSSFVMVYFSTLISKRIYLLQDTLLERTYDKAIKEKAQETKNHLEKKYGE